MIAACATPPTSPAASAATVGGAPHRWSCFLVVTLLNMNTAPMSAPSTVRLGDPVQSAPIPPLEMICRVACTGLSLVIVTGKSNNNVSKLHNAMDQHQRQDTKRCTTKTFSLLLLVHKQPYLVF